MKRPLASLLVLVSGLLAVGCNGGGGATLADTPDKPRPAPGTPTKDVMIPAAKTAGQ